MHTVTCLKIEMSRLVDWAWFQPRTTDAQVFLHRNPELLGLGRQIGQTNWINSGTFGVFSAELSAPSWYINQPLFLKKTLILYIQIPNVYLGLGFEFEFGPQRIRDLAIVCP